MIRVWFVCVRRQQHRCLTRSGVLSVVERGAGGELLYSQFLRTKNMPDPLRTWHLNVFYFLRFRLRVTLLFGFFGFFLENHQIRLSFVRESALTVCGCVIRQCIIKSLFLLYSESEKQNFHLGTAVVVSTPETSL